MYRKIILVFLSMFSLSYAVDDIDIEKRRQEQQNFDELIRNQNFLTPLINFYKIFYFHIFL